MLRRTARSTLACRLESACRSGFGGIGSDISSADARERVGESAYEALHIREPSAQSLHTLVNATSSRRGPGPTSNAVARQETMGNQVIENSGEEQWTAVLDKSTGGTYWWNQKTGETTAVGEPKPGPLGRVAFAGVQRVGFVKAMVSMAAMGLGMGLMFGIVGKIF